MMFSYLNSSYMLEKVFFRDDLYKAFGAFNSIRIGTKITPFTPSAIDESKHITFMKLYQEYLERFRMGINTEKIDKIQSLDVLNSKIYQRSRALFGYGYNEEYGFVDTTGTSSGYFSKKLKQKAICELIEKNEAMLLWYAGKGSIVRQDERVKDLINKTGLSSHDVFIFAINEIANIYTIVVLTFKDQKIISTGVSLENDPLVSLEKALMECRLLEIYYNMFRISFHYKLNEKEHSSIYKYVNSLSHSLNSIELMNDNFDKIVMKAWVKSMEFVVLNTNKYQEFLTIRCISKELLNSVPSHNVILNSLNKRIIKEFSIDENTLKQKPDCIIL